MKIDLSLIGMEKGRQYETIISTVNLDKQKNAAPIGVICSGSDKILCRIFKGSHTLDNILSTKEFIVNIHAARQGIRVFCRKNISKMYCR